MTDVFNSNVRKKIMASVRSTNTKPELIVRTFLHNNGFRYRLHVRDLPGRPDIVLPKYNIIIFVNGCFWHKHHCTRASIPKTNTTFWVEKLSKNVIRDEENILLLKKLGWNVIVIWQCEISVEFLSQLLKTFKSYSNKKI